MKTCGNLGGLTSKGTPCQKRSGAICAMHAKIEDEHTQLKADFLDVCESGQKTIKQAAKKVGSSQPSIWRLRQADPEFDVAVRNVALAADRTRLEIAEDTLFSRIKNDTATPAELFFYLVNRSVGRWRHVSHVRHEGSDGGAVAVEVDEVRERFARRIAGLASRLGEGQGDPASNGRAPSVP